MDFTLRSTRSRNNNENENHKDKSKEKRAKRAEDDKISLTKRKDFFAKYAMESKRLQNPRVTYEDTPHQEACTTDCTTAVEVDPAAEIAAAKAAANAAARRGRETMRRFKEMRKKKKNAKSRTINELQNCDFLAKFNTLT